MLTIMLVTACYKLLASVFTTPPLLSMKFLPCLELGPHTGRLLQNARDRVSAAKLVLFAVLLNEAATFPASPVSTTPITDVRLRF
jgi:hypothetical protein